MRISELKDCLDAFVENSSIKSILIDGEWGVGKTHFIKRYFGIGLSCCKRRRGKKKNVALGKKVLYVSLFGKEKVDEIHTELFNQFRWRKVAKILSKVIKLCPKVGDKLSSLSNDLIEASEEKNCKSESAVIKKAGTRKIRKTVIVIDDFERKSVCENVLLGYLISLIDQGFKVVVVGNFKKNSKEEDVKKEECLCLKCDQRKSKLEKGITEYKEKVFDRVYEITQTQEESIEKLLGVNYKYHQVCFFVKGENLRNIIKANSLFNEIKARVVEKEFTIDTIDFGKLFECCIIIVEENLTRKYTSKIENKEDNLTRAMIDASGSLKSYDILCGITIVTKRQNRDGDNEYLSMAMLSAVDKIFLENDWSAFEKLYSKKTESILSVDMRLLSDEELANTIVEQKELVFQMLNKKDSLELGEKIEHLIVKWLHYEYSISEDEKSKLFDKLYELEISPEGFASHARAGYKNTSEFYKSFTKFCDEKNFLELKEKVSSVYNQFKTASIDKEKAKAFDAIRKLIKELIRDLNAPDSEWRTLRYSIIKENNFFIGNFSGTVDKYVFELASWVLRELQYVGGSGFEVLPKDEFFNILKKQAEDNKDDGQLQRRVLMFLPQESQQ